MQITTHSLRQTALACSEIIIGPVPWSPSWRSSPPLPSSLPPSLSFPPTLPIFDPKLPSPDVDVNSPVGCLHPVFQTREPRPEVPKPQCGKHVPSPQQRKGDMRRLPAYGRVEGVEGQAAERGPATCSPCSLLPEISLNSGHRPISFFFFLPYPFCFL